MVEYLKQMSEIVVNSPSKEESEQALGAIVTEIKGKEALIATDQKLSKVLEKLVDSNGASVSVLKPIFCQLQSCVLDLIYDQYGSHVLETVLKSVSTAKCDDELASIVSSFSESLCSDIASLLSDSRSTFVVRSAALVFAGFPRPEGQSDLLEELKVLKQSEDRNKFIDLFEQLVFSVSELGIDSIKQLASATHSSVTLQLLVVLASKLNVADSLISRIICDDNRSIDKDMLRGMLNSPSSAKLLEVVVSVLNTSKSETSRRILLEFIIADCGSPYSVFDCKFSFAFLQSFVSSLEDTELMTRFVYEFMTVDGITRGVAKGKGNGIALIQRTIESLSRLFDSQKQFVDCLLAAVKADRNNAWMSILSISPASFGESVSDSRIDEAQITPQGCLLMSSLLKLKQSAIQPIITGTQAFVEYLKGFDFTSSKFTNEMGPGRMLQTLLSSECSLPMGMKKKIIKQLVLGDDAVQRLGKLTSDRKVGSWIVTTIWDTCAGDIDTKHRLGEALLSIEGIREINWKVWKHCGLASFSRRNEEWTQTEKKKSKAQNLLRDIIGEDFQSAKKQRSH
jgi:hypothetical protein